jgi:two-component system, response regulator PdtaR
MKPILLVVEDELLVRLDFADLAQAAGFETVEASSADEAVEILQSRDDIKVMFTDIRMPGSMDGMALAHYVRDRWPPTIIVICSGNKPPDAETLPREARFVSKPCTGDRTEKLLENIKAQLN